MRKLLFLTLVLSCQSAFSAVLPEKSYYCKEKRVIQSIAANPQLVVLNGEALFDMVRANGGEVGKKLAEIDLEIARSKERVEADRVVVHDGQALEFQTGIRQNWRATEQAIRDGNDRIENLKRDRERIAGRLEPWTDITQLCVPVDSQVEVKVIRGAPTGKLSEVQLLVGETPTKVWVLSRFLGKTAVSKPKK